jgi:hypothetical protein
LADDLQNLRFASLKNICKMIIYRYKKRTETKMWQLYLMKYTHMDKKNFVSFEEFYNVKSEAMIKETEGKTDDEIIDEVAKIRERIKGKK